MKPRPHITVSIPIPKAIDELIARCKYAYTKAKFKLRPYRCALCNTALTVKSPEYEYTVPNACGNVGSRLLVHNFSWRDSPALCRSCLVHELETKEWTPRFTHSSKSKDMSTRYNYRFWSTKKCDITGKKVRAYKDVEIYPYIDMTFCTIAWNHSYISKEAVIDCIKYGTIRTGHWGVWNKQKMAPMNEAGLFIDENGDLL